jgi:hypothetical protein
MLANCLQFLAKKPVKIMQIKVSFKASADN